MEFGQIKGNSEDNFDESIGLMQGLERYLVYRKWFILSVLLFGVLAFLKLRYEVPQYNVSASILIKEKEKGSSFNDLSSFEDLGLFGSGNESLENEIQILKSRRLMTKVVKELNLNIQYFIENNPYDVEQYPNFPIIVNFQSDSSTINNIETNFQILVKSDKKFEFIGFDGNSKGIKIFNNDFQANLGNEDEPNMRGVSISLNQNLKNSLIGEKINVLITPVNNVVNNYMSRLIIEPVNEKLSKVLRLSIDEPIKEKGIAIVNNLIDQYNADGISDKNEIAQTTIDFLDSRLDLISTELMAIESTAEQFKTKNQMVNINTGADIFLQTSSSNESELINANTQLKLVEYMYDELNRNSSSELLPANSGLSNQTITTLIGEYNELILRRKRILTSSTNINPLIVGIDSQLNVLRNNLNSSLNGIKSSLRIQINALNTQGGRINSKIASVPKNEREFKDIVRQQETKNSLYLFLLQKREESILSNSVSVEKAKIIDQAYSNGRPVSPKKLITYLGSFILGVLLPFIVIYLKDLLDTKVHDENDIKKLKIPFLGDVPLTISKKDLYISDLDNSNIAEAFRYIRTNINFMLDSKSIGKTVFVTSTQSHEGKTFTAINLASSLAISGKKTLILGMDLRAPKISKYLMLEDNPGVTNFISDDSLTIEDITEKHAKIKNLDLINSGDIPPNPVEMLMSKRVREIFELVKGKYDFIIVDSAPVGMVTDTIQIGKYADLTIYVIKANFLDKRMLHIPEKLNKENKLPNMAILINGSDHSKGAYGYGYGYGYGNKKKTAWYKGLLKDVAM